LDSKHHVASLYNVVGASVNCYWRGRRNSSRTNRKGSTVHIVGIQKERSEDWPFVRAFRRRQGLIEGFRAEATIQRQLNMITDLQIQAIEQVASLEGGSKVSGAGAGGVLVIAASDERHAASLRSSLKALGLESILVGADSDGITIESAERRLY
jgi:mevalonate kinase